MTGQRGAWSSNESPAFFQAGDNALFGVLTRPPTDPLGIVVIVLSAGGTVSTDRNRLAVRLCRHVAELGFHSLRFDYQGTGESEGDSRRFRLDEPFTSDLMGAVEWARTFGLERVVLIGSCFGGRTALACARDIGGLEGVALVATPVRDYEMGDRITTGLATRGGFSHYVRHAIQPHLLLRLLDPQKRQVYARAVRATWRSLLTRNGTLDGRDEELASPLFVNTFAKLVDRSVPTLLVNGSDDDLWHDFQRARSGRLGELLAAGSDTIELMTLPGHVHGFKSVAVQDAFVDGVSDWLSRLASRAEFAVTGG